MRRTFFFNCDSKITKLLGVVKRMNLYNVTTVDQDSRVQRCVVIQNILSKLVSKGMLIATSNPLPFFYHVLTILIADHIKKYSMHAYIHVKHIRINHICQTNQTIDVKVSFQQFDILLWFLVRIWTNLA